MNRLLSLLGNFLLRVNRINAKIEVNPEVIFLNQPTQSATVREKVWRGKQKNEPKIVKRSDDSFIPCWKCCTYGGVSGNVGASARPYVCGLPCLFSPANYDKYGKSMWLKTSMSQSISCCSVVPTHPHTLTFDRTVSFQLCWKWWFIIHIDFLRETEYPLTFCRSMNNGHATPHHTFRNRNQNAMNGGVSSERFPIENEMKRIYYSNNLSIWAFLRLPPFGFLLCNPLKEVWAVEKKSHYRLTPECASEANRKKRREINKKSKSEQKKK